jgi:hypothetical protein
MDALGSGSIPLLVPVTPTAAPPPLPPAPNPGSRGAVAVGPADVCEPPKLRLLRPRPRRRAKLPSFPAGPGAPDATDGGDPCTPKARRSGSFGARSPLARAVSNSSASSGGGIYRRCSSSIDFSSTPSVSPFAAYSDTPFEDDDEV